MKKSFFTIVLISSIFFTSCTTNRNVAEDITGTPADFESSESTTVIIMVPENMELYRQQMTEYAQVGGLDPLPATKFIQKNIIVPYTSSIIKASVETALVGIPLGGGPDKAYVTYLNVGADTVYILLNIDIDGWAGASTALAIIHPIVEKTLLLFPEIKKVVFDYAPADKIAEVK